MSDLVYVYGFAPANASPPSDLAGVGGRNVELIRTGGVCAVISRVPADEYNSERIENRLQDLSWVADQGVAHETVVAWFVDHSQIVPVALFTLYSGAPALLEDIGPRVGQLEAELERLGSRREWDLKVSFQERELEQHAAALSSRIAELEQQLAQATPGKRYLLEKKRNDLVKSETRQAAHSLATELLELLRPLAAEARTVPLPRTTSELPVILYAALLVERDREEALVQQLEEEAARLQALGLSVAFSGPWAPYRFTGEHERAAANPA